MLVSAATVSKPKPSPQLDMFDGAIRQLQSDNEQLRQRVASLEADHSRLIDQLDTARGINRQIKKQNTKLQRDNQTLFKSVRELQERNADYNARRVIASDLADKYRDENSSLQRQIELLQVQTRVLELRIAEAQSAPAEPALLRQLLRICHPDLWSQGQSATELAHLMSIEINRLRDQAR